MNWHHLDSIDDLTEAIKNSDDKYVLLFKHSTTCSISHMAKLRLESSWDETADILPYYLDLKAYRNISNEIAEQFSVHHESPQVLLIRNGECIYDESHLDITFDNIVEAKLQDA
jgi:bacillithiol system protein YtxJ